MNHPKKHCGASWDHPHDSVAAIEDFQSEISKSCSSLACPKGTDLTVDDDKMRNRSAKAKECGWGRSKGLKSHGPANNMIGATCTGLFYACHVSLFGESALESFKHMLLSTSRAKLLDKVNLHGATMHCNQGFNGNKCFEFCDNHDVDSVNACKRAPPLPFVFGNAKCKTKTVQKRCQNVVQKLFVDQDNN